MYTVAVVTVSDRSYAGEREDTAGPGVAAMLKDVGFDVQKTVIVPDEREQIEETLVRLAEEDFALVVTTGGTGFSPRDVTPEATLAVCERRVDGIPEAMRAASMKITPRAMLSRAAAGIRGRTLIVNLPGSPKAAKENLAAVIGSLEHGLLMLRGGPADCAAQTEKTAGKPRQPAK
ncbi:MAG: MogA/MoaB family molybdenum cofactor biosynthesis protein [Eubacteriales bacterium]|nr:MogA/MoaB family molybdenum cofactor biosynthesis protein [Eubacteriales bacterium]